VREEKAIKVFAPTFKTQIFEKYAVKGKNFRIRLLEENS
jgi:hypothetical protein